MWARGLVGQRFARRIHVVERFDRPSHRVVLVSEIRRLTMSISENLSGTCVRLGGREWYKKRRGVARAVAWLVSVVVIICSTARCADGAGLKHSEKRQTFAACRPVSSWRKIKA